MTLLPAAPQSKALLDGEWPEWIWPETLYSGLVSGFMFKTEPTWWLLVSVRDCLALFPLKQCFWCLLKLSPDPLERQFGELKEQKKIGYGRII